MTRSVISQPQRLFLSTILINFVLFTGGIFLCAFRSNLYPTFDPHISGNVTDLKQLFMLFRHGAKVPDSLLLQGKDKTKFRDYVGQLTNEGKMSLFNLGQSLRGRYGNFIGDYDAQRFFIGSTAMDRTLMSAQCLSLGLFPPEGARVWKPDLQWQPIPVYPLEFSLTGSLLNSVKNFRKVLDMVCKNQDNYLSDKNKKTLAKLQHTIPGKYSNKTAHHNHTCDIDSVMNLDHLSTMIWYNMSLPPALVGMEDDIDDLKSVIIKAISTSNTALGKSIAGAVLKNVLQRISDLESGSTNFSAVFFSEHDINVFATVMALSDVNIRSPSFGSNLILEVRHAPADANLKPEVHMWYAASAESPSIRITFKANQSHRIGLEEFKSFIRDYLSDTKSANGVEEKNVD